MDRRVPTDRRVSGAIRKASVVATVLTTVAVALNGCGASVPATDGSSASATVGSVVQVVAAENFWGSIASQIGGIHAHVVSIITNPSTDPHGYEPTAGN